MPTDEERRRVLRERAGQRALDFMCRHGLVGFVTWSAAELGEHFVDLLLAVEAEAEAREREYWEPTLRSLIGGWHGCALRKPERGMPAGRLCDDCEGQIAAALKEPAVIPPIKGPVNPDWP